MAAINLVLGLMVLAATAYSEDVKLSLKPLLTGGFELGLTSGEEENILGTIGKTLTSTYGVTAEEFEGGLRLDLGSAELTINTLIDEAANARGIKVRWNTEHPEVRFQDCFDFGTKQWYGGPMQLEQVYPIQKAKQNYSPYVTKEDDNGAIIERYWLNSAGEYIYVHPQVPLFVDYNNLQSNHLCLGAQIAEPYSTKRNHTELTYDIWYLLDVKAAHQHAVANYLGKPTGVPDYRMVQHPIWSTWAQFSRDIDEENLMEFAHQIRDYGFQDSQFEIDDLWEVCYGSLTINENKFSNFSKLVQDIKALGYRVTLWIHPFINNDCEPWYSEALQNNYLILNEEGNPDTSWWNNNGSVPGYIDFTNPAAADWWYTRVKHIQDTYDIDSFKFDAGESSFTPQVPVQTGDTDLHPHHVTQAYVKTCAKFGDMIEVRTGFRTQNLPVFVRMVDRDSIWGVNNGLTTIITTTLQMNLNGYTLVLPDMIGGNGFNLAHEDSGLPTKQLFIRWVQANTFLPAMQYSFVPWNFDEEAVAISKKYTELHASFADEIYAAMKASVDQGTPVNAPLWWIDPKDKDALLVADEYLLGETILVAPVLVENATSRDIYLPTGTWLEEGDSERKYTGPVWLQAHPAPLDYLPYFIKQTGDATTPYVAVSLVLFSLIANFFNGF